jgi:hypothetical protein
MVLVFLIFYLVVCFLGFILEELALFEIFFLEVFLLFFRLN